MFYEPSTRRLFKTIDEFKINYKDTSFGDLSLEENRNAIGLFQVTETNVEYDNQLTTKELEGVEIVDGRYRTKWKFVPKQLSTEEFQDIERRKQERLRAELIGFAQRKLDDFAKTRGYDGILSACSYAYSSNLKFSKEGKYCLDARDSVWAFLGEFLQANETLPEDLSDIEKMLPKLEWPN